MPADYITVHPIGSSTPLHIPATPLPAPPDPTDRGLFESRASTFLKAMSVRALCDYCKTPYLTARPVICRHCGAPAK